MRSNIYPIHLIALCVFLLAGCSSSYRIPDDYPRPLVEPIPIQLDLHIDDNFANYIYKEDREQRRNVSVQLGEAQTSLFNTVTRAMFTGEDGAPTLRMIPAVEAFQYAIPRETRAEIYEVWLKYRITIEEPDGTVLADWLMTGYGKTPTALLRGQSDAIKSAANQALRDIGTQLSIGFKQQPDVSLWLTDNVEGGNQ